LLNNKHFNLLNQYERERVRDSKAKMTLNKRIKDLTVEDLKDLYFAIEPRQTRTSAFAIAASHTLTQLINRCLVTEQKIFT
jgi:hypothetical protein